MINQSASADWPALPLGEWADTCATLRLWTQIVGKIRLAHTPLVNHWWNVPLYVTSRGLTTSAMPHGARDFQIPMQPRLSWLDGIGLPWNARQMLAFPAATAHNPVR